MGQRQRSSSRCIKRNLSRILALFIFLGNGMFTVITESDGLCTKLKDCESISHMVCLGWKCVCITGLAYDSIHGKCAKIVGQGCANATISKKIQSIDEIPCASNAHCDSSTNTCVCNRPDYSVWNETGFCYVNYGKTCNNSQSHLNCNPNKYLKCAFSDMKCGCVSFGQIYDVDRDSCVAKPGELCDGIEVSGMQILRCTQNAHCAPSTNYNNRNHEDYLTFRCKCNIGYVDISNAYCMPMYASKCSLEINSTAELTCAPNFNLVCEKAVASTEITGESLGRCACSPGSVLVPPVVPVPINDDEYELDEGVDADYAVEYMDSDYESSDGHCAQIRLHGEFCSPAKDVCTPNSACVENTRFTYYRSFTNFCQCLPGYDSTPNETCKVAYNQLCASSNECNEHLGLQCLDGKCTCSTVMSKFNGTHCVVVEGGDCNEHASNFCTANAYCNVDRSKCECAQFHSVDQELRDRKCYPAVIGIGCNLENPCLKSIGLSCVDDVCICGRSDGFETGHDDLGFEMSDGKCMERVEKKVEDGVSNSDSNYKSHSVHYYLLLLIATVLLFYF